LGSYQEALADSALTVCQAVLGNGVGRTAPLPPEGGAVSRVGVSFAERADRWWRVWACAKQVMPVAPASSG